MEKVTISNRKYWRLIFGSNSLRMFFKCVGKYFCQCVLKKLLHKGSCLQVFPSLYTRQSHINLPLSLECKLYFAPSISWLKKACLVKLVFFVDCYKIWHQPLVICKACQSFSCLSVQFLMTSAEMTKTD